MKVTRNFICLVLVVGAAVVSGNARVPSAIERELVRRLETISKLGNYSGNFDEKVYDENKAFKAQLVEYGKRADVLRYSFIDSTGSIL